MSIDKVVVIIGGIIGIAFTFWFFLLKKEKVVQTNGFVDIIVDGGFLPEVISIPKGKITQITFLRKDQNKCLEEVILPDFKIKKTLPLRKKISIEIKPQNAGEYNYSCGMNMFHGKIIVRG